MVSTEVHARLQKGSAPILLNIANAYVLRTPNEGINQRNLNIWADVADKICFGST